ncbi:MAG: hypothetical protein QME71_02750 [Dehalococcoidia bacterium]|nr:hypothetical protein [Dehalococcoidia bacterium]
MWSRSTRRQGGRRSPGPVRIAALMSSVAFVVAVLSKVWPL